MTIVASSSSRSSSSRSLISLCRAITVVCVVATMITLAARTWWVADLFANLRVQLMLALFGSLLFLLTCRQWKLAAIVVVLAIWQCTALRSAFEFPSPAGAGSGSFNEVVTDSHQRFRICTNNVHTANRNFDLILQSISEADSDVVAVIELSTALGHKLQADLSEIYPHQIFRVNDDGNFGIGLLSKFPLQKSEVFYLCEPLVPSIEADVELPNGVVRVIATHPFPPVRSGAFGARNLHLSMLADRVQLSRTLDPQRSIVVVGDLNLTPWSPIFDDFLAESRLQNASAGRGLTPTWYRWNAFPFGLVIDHALHSDNLKCLSRTVLGQTGSDHRPVVFELML